MYHVHSRVYHIQDYSVLHSTPKPQHSSTFPRHANCLHLFPQMHTVSPCDLPIHLLLVRLLFWFTTYAEFLLRVLTLLLYNGAAPPTMAATLSPTITGLWTTKNNPSVKYQKKSSKIHTLKDISVFFQAVPFSHRKVSILVSKME